MTVRRWVRNGLALSRTAEAAGRLAWSAAPVGAVCEGLLALATAALPVVVAWLTKLVVDALSAGSTVSLDRLLWLACGLVAAGLLLALLPRASTFVGQEAGRAIALRIQDLLYRAVDGFHGLARFEDPVFLDRMRMAKQSAAQAPKMVVDAGISLCGGVVTGVGFLGSLVIVNPALAAIVLVAAVPALIAQLRLSRERAAVMWMIGPAERREFFFSTLLTDVQAAKEIRLFGAGRFLRERMLTERRTADAAKHRQDLRDLLTQGGLAALSAAVAGGGLVWAIVQAYQGVITAGDVTMLVAAVAGVQSALTQLTTALAGTYQQLLMFDHFRTVTRAGSDLSVPASPVAAPPLRRGIELRDVWFRYSERHPWVLRGVDLFVPAGRATALVGRNGAGKSTVVKLLCRFYDPCRGAILWDGVDLREMDIAQLRRRLGAVFQDFMHYDLTATENIALGDTALLADRERIVAAARLAGAHDTLAALPHGYDTMLSRMYFSEQDKEDPETGVVLSGGQWQRLALARAFLRDQRDLLILDEPSSGLDALAEHEMHAKLREHRSGRTSILISHRLGAIRDADQIVVLDGGQIVERGDHGELMKARGSYAELFELQAAGYQPDVVAG